MNRTGFRDFVNDLSPLRPVVDSPFSSVEQWQAADYTVREQFQRRAPATSALLMCKDLVLETKNLPTADMKLSEDSTRLLSEKTMPNGMFEIQNLPLPFCHTEAYPAAEINDSLLRVYARRVAEKSEEVLLGLDVMFDTLTLSPALYGLGNHPRRHTLATTKGIFDAPTEVLDTAIILLKNEGFHGPYILVVHEPFAKCDYTHPEVQTMIPTHSKNSCFLFQATPDVFRLVVTLMPSCFMWEGKFKVAASIVPQIRQPEGICHLFPPEGVVK